MKNFVNFERAYKAQKEARRSLVSFPVSRIIPYYENDFYKSRNQALSNIDVVLEVLRGWFNGNFPADTKDAVRCEQFSYPVFFAMLKRNPELLEGNAEKLQELLCSLRARGLYGTGLESVPKIDEFINKDLRDGKEVISASVADVKNFTIFERAYKAQKEARRAILSFSVSKVIEYYENDFHTSQMCTLSNLDVVMEVLLEWFDKSFPVDVADAVHCNQFSYQAFLAMLKENSELVESNENTLKGFLYSLRARGLYGTGLQEYPTIDEFVTENMKRKKVEVEAALEALRKVASEALKVELRPVEEYLTARRPLTRGAYFKLLSMCNTVEKSTEDYKFIEEAKLCLNRV